MSWSGVTKYLLGFVLAIAILFGAGTGLTRYVLARLSVPPPRPTFANDPSPPKPSPAAAQPSPATAQASPAAAQPSPTPSDSPSSSPSPSPEGYPARVTQPVGLILRQDPSAGAAKIGGVEYNQQVTVLEDSQDGGWQRVRLADSSEGWVKAGNTDRIN
jgi:hypothetical protein